MLGRGGGHRDVRVCYARSHGPGPRSLHSPLDLAARTPSGIHESAGSNNRAARAHSAEPNTTPRDLRGTSRSVPSQRRSAPRYPRPAPFVAWIVDPIVTACSVNAVAASHQDAGLLRSETEIATGSQLTHEPG